MDINHKKAMIMMATYNGESYIKEQIQSLQKQTFKDWELYISDDHSTDHTLNILKDLQKEDPRIKKIITNNTQYHGAFANYFNLMRYVQTHCAPVDYYFYCDQDDIWDEKKISLEIKSMEKLEEKYGKTNPVFCYCDLEFYDKNGTDQHDKMSNHIRTQFIDNPYNSFFKDQYVWGTTIGHNFALWKLVNLGTSAQVKNNISHDVYLSKYALTYAQIAYIPVTLVKYRRTGNNVSGTPGVYTISNVLKKIINFNQIIDDAARNFWGTLFFAYHVPKKSEVIKDIKECFNNKGQKKFFNKYDVLKNESTLGKISTKVVLSTGLYKHSSIFKHERYK
ncbi:glycosyltransferase [Lactobacillus intestinalis]|uniref:Glycosyl transferase family 2 n=1 Tax=Lactobacillus intestinalis DSM 6629 TaxID=1423761 RepID=A0ABR5PNX5_9LACO|nr:glycosyltransferase [Lactobacillus intestinalis]KRM31307.1 glycosyl transferase family 2 [Lactobacillus intestinalis DSM 6629]UTW40137.1 glycosyltransferase [Lactobacillus intestinalis]